MNCNEWWKHLFSFLDIVEEFTCILRESFFNSLVFFFTVLFLGFLWCNSVIIGVNFQWLPESARYLAANGKTEEALTVLQRVAKENGKPMITGRLIVDDLSSPDGGPSSGTESSMSPDPMNGYSPLRRLLSTELKLTSLLLWSVLLLLIFLMKN